MHNGIRRLITNTLFLVSENILYTRLLMKSVRECASQLYTRYFNSLPCLISILIKLYLIIRHTSIKNIGGLIFYEPNYVYIREVLFEKKKMLHYYVQNSIVSVNKVSTVYYLYIYIYTTYTIRAVLRDFLENSNYYSKNHRRTGVNITRDFVQRAFSPSA